MKRNNFQKYIWLVVIILLFSCKKSEHTFDGSNGTKVEHFPSGKIRAKKEYKEGKLHGRFVEFYENGQVEEEIFYKENYKDGVYNSYYEDGVLKARMYFKLSRKDSICSYFYKNGQLKKEEFYKGGELEGPSKAYHENGALAFELNYKNGNKHGIQKYFYENGQLKALTDLKHGRASTKLEEYSKEGKRIDHRLQIVSREVNKMALDEIYIYQFKLNKEDNDVKFFIGDLEDGYFPISRFELKKEGDYWVKSFFVPKYSFLMDKMNVIAITKSHFGNDIILTKKLNLALNNFN